MTWFWEQLGTHPETGMATHLPMGVNADGQGPESDSKSDHYVCWCGDLQCPLNQALLLASKSNQSRWESSMDERVAVHLGIYPDQKLGLQVNDFWYKDEEEKLPIESVEAYISGSWKCWGPADQGTDGDDSLHIVVYTRHHDKKDIENLKKAIMSLPRTTGQMLSETVITTVEDWSVVLSTV